MSKLSNNAPIIPAVFPLIIIDKNSSLNVVLNADVFSKASTRALIDKSCFDTVDLFDKNGCKWKYRRVSTAFKNNWVTRLLASTVYNPAINAEVLWTFSGLYELAELKKRLKNCVDLDDDSITQFEGGNVINTAIEIARDFDEILAVLNKYVFDVDEEQLWKEQEAGSRKQEAGSKRRNRLKASAALQLGCT